MHARDKIRSIGELAALVEGLKREGKRVVHCHGVFDLMHVGHIRHFQQAKAFGDVLVVTVTPDRFVNKGPHRPVFPEDLRVEVVASVEYVAFAAVNEWPKAVETIRALKPDFYVKGGEYANEADDVTGGITLEREAVEAAGGKLVFTDDITFSSSHLINRHLPVYSGELASYLAEFSKRFSRNDVMRCLDEIRRLKVLVLGEAIIDEYHYCETMGKTGKEPILAARYIYDEKFAGGVLAAANHLSSFSDGVAVLTVLGAADSQKEFIEESLDKGIERHFLFRAGAPTIVKRRFVESYPFQKIFEVYVMSDEEERAQDARALCVELEELLPRFDVVVVTDYGHGMLGPDAVEVLCRKAKFLAVNTQVNAGNYGFNTISKYPRADFISISEREIRLETRSLRRDLREVIRDVSEKLTCPRMIVTQGKSGCLCYGSDESFISVPALTGRIVDRVGAGDAVFAVTSLCAALGAPIEVTGLIGNAVGAQAVSTVGNRRAVERVALIKHIESLLR